MMALIFGGIIKRILNFWAWLTEKPIRLAIMAAALSAFILFQWGNHYRKDDIRVRGLLAAETSAHANDIAKWKAASELAEKHQAANLERVKHENDRNATVAVASLARTDADWRARFDRLRASNNRSTSSGATMSAVSTPAGRIAQANPDTPGLDPALITVKIDDLEALVSGANQGEAIRRLWMSNEDVDTSHVATPH